MYGGHIIGDPQAISVNNLYKSHIIISLNDEYDLILLYLIL